MMGERWEKSGMESLLSLGYIDLTGESVLAKHGLLSLNDQLLIGRYQITSAVVRGGSTSH